jgi:hypothetical protein
MLPALHVYLQTFLHNKECGVVFERSTRVYQLEVKLPQKLWQHLVHLK